MTNKDQKHLVIAAAGTGGHVMPGLAVAREMVRRGWRISWIGTEKGMESRLVAKDGIDFTALDFQGVRGKGALGMVSGAWKLFCSSRRCKQLMKTMNPDVVFTTGGYVAVPVCYGAQKTGKKIVLMNCDADLLMSSEMILRKAWGVACGFAGSARSAAGGKGVITGNPVRSEIAAIEPPEVRLKGREGRLKLLVFGGSLGARVLNETLPKALALFDPAVRPEVVHQCGANSVETVQRLYQDAGVQAQVVGFIDDMAAAYRESDIVVCRAGATSVAEICAAGVAAILVPFVAKTTAHQMGNARYMDEHQAGILMDQKQLTAEHLFGVLASLKRDRILKIAQNARALSRTDAVASVADMIERVDAMDRMPA